MSPDADRNKHARGFRERRSLAEQLRPYQESGQLPSAQAATTAEAIVALRARHWSEGGSSLDTEIPPHPPSIRVISSLDEIFSLALLADRSSHEAAVTYRNFARALLRGAEKARLEVRSDAGNGWRRLQKFAAAGSAAPQSTSVRFRFAHLPESEEAWSTVVESLRSRNDLVPRGATAQPSSRQQIDRLWAVLEGLAHPSSAPADTRLEEADVKLALSWARDSVSHGDGLQLEALIRNDWPVVQRHLRALKPEDSPRVYWEVERCLSARGAELYVRDIRREAGQAVEDLSILQVVKPEDLRWQIADLEADGELVDVKNVRYVQGTNRQAWPLVKRFKARDDGRSILYDGVGSAFRRSLGEHLDGNRASITYYGSVTEARLAELERLGEGSMRVALRRRSENGAKLADWCFALPERAAPHLIETISQLAELYASLPDRVSGLRPERRAMIRTRLRDGDRIDVKSASKDAAASLYYLADFVREHGREPAVLAIGLMNLFGEGASRGDALSMLAAVHPLFGVRQQCPLGVFDPSGALSRLYGNLLLVAAHRASWECMSAIELVGPLWLRAQKESGETETLFVYCGQCGEFPLTRGTNAICPHGTGRLVCGRCGHCCGQRGRRASQ